LDSGVDASTPCHFRGLVISTSAEESIHEFLNNPHFWNLEDVAKRRIAELRLGALIPPTSDALWFRVVTAFVRDAPLRYWDKARLRQALDILEADPKRTAEALSGRERELGVGFELLLLQSPATGDEGAISSFSIANVQRLATLFHPEYLRYSEHVFGNLIVIYWAVLRNRGLAGKFGLRGAVEYLIREGHGDLVSGYDERLRNGIAHGQVIFRGLDVAYGPEAARHQLPVGDVLGTFDDLIRTVNCLALALLLFLCRNMEHLSPLPALPPRLVVLLAGAVFDEASMKVMGAYESRGVGDIQQLHIGITTPLIAREAVLFLVLSLGRRLVQWVGGAYDRFVFEIDQGRPSKGLAIVDARILSRLIEETAPIRRLPEALPDLQLLWHHEGRIRRRWRAWTMIASIVWRNQRERLSLDREKPGRVDVKARFLIRSVDDITMGSWPRLRVVAVLADSDDSNNRLIVRQVLAAINRKARRRWVRVQFGANDHFRVRPVRPRQITVSLYREDGTLRWLGRGGWLGGNLVAVSELIIGSIARHPPILVKHPEETWGGLRIRYSIDLTQAADIQRRVDELIKDVSRESSDTTR